MNQISKEQLSYLINQNPIRDYLITGSIEKIIEPNEIEKEYIIDKQSNAFNIFIRKPGDSNLFSYIDQNKLLSLYHEYDCVYGPYIETTTELIEYVLILFRKFKRKTYLKIIYFKRALEEISLNKILGYSYKLNKDISIEDLVKNLPVVNKKCIRFSSNLPKLEQEDIEKILKLYPEFNKMSQPYYDTTWDNFEVLLYNKYVVKKVKLIKLLYEIHINQRLREDQRVVQKNNLSRDISIDNLEIFDPISKATKLWRLDVIKLLEIYKKLGNFKFIGCFEKTFNNTNMLRRRTVLLENKDTKQRTEMALAKAKMTVKLNRLLAEDETVDHIDRNYLNDNTDNLRVINIYDHTKEDAFNIEIDPIECPVCGTIFIPSKTQKNKSKNRGSNLYCSKVCTGKSRNLIKKNLITPISYKDLNVRYYKLIKNENRVIGKEYFHFKEKYKALEEAKSLVRIVPIDN